MRGDQLKCLNDNMRKALRLSYTVATGTIMV